MSAILRVTSDLAAERPVPFSKFGIVGDGKTFDHTGVRNLVDALDNAGTVHLGGNPLMLLGETVTLSDRASLTLTTDREPNVEQRHVSPCFLWDGPKGGDMLMLDRCRNVTLDGLVFETDDFFRVRAPAGRAIVLDGGQDTHPESSAIGTTCRLKNLRHATYPGALDVEATFITIATATKMNQEFHEIVHCGGNGNNRGVFLHQGPSYNAKNTKLTGTRYASAYRRAVWMENGSMKLAHNNMNWNEWDLFLEAATGYVTETGHVGENSRHHAFINCPFSSVDGTYDHARTYPRSTAPVGLPSYGDEVGGHEEAWIHFGGFASDVSIARATVSRPPADTVKLFGWMYDRSLARYELGPFWLGQGHTRASLGLDKPTLDRIAGMPKILFHNRATDTNPHGPGVLDLPCGEFVYNDQATLCETKGLS